ncbi:uncharacterized protein LOC134844414 isoform X2 [Symsagittifera roscoffensis]|uniref:uncharacterized protein LOC134844414 isoform X2 n=1 Tax=Symsagittifera roscoffensis TaxID=84072 RepID=UPI00307CAC91
MNLESGQVFLKGTKANFDGVEMANEEHGSSSASSSGIFASLESDPVHSANDDGSPPKKKLKEENVKENLKEKQKRIVPIKINRPKGLTKEGKVNWGVAVKTEPESTSISETEESTVSSESETVVSQKILDATISKHSRIVEESTVSTESEAGNPEIGNNTHDIVNPNAIASTVMTDSEDIGNPIENESLVSTETEANVLNLCQTDAARGELSNCLGAEPQKESEKAAIICQSNVNSPMVLDMDAQRTVLLKENEESIISSESDSVVSKNTPQELALNDAESTEDSVVSTESEAGNVEVANDTVGGRPVLFSHNLHQPTTSPLIFANAVSEPSSESHTGGEILTENENRSDTFRNYEQAVGNVASMMEERRRDIAENYAKAVDHVASNFEPPPISEAKRPEARKDSVERHREIAANFCKAVDQVATNFESPPVTVAEISEVTRQESGESRLNISANYAKAVDQVASSFESTSNRSQPPYPNVTVPFSHRSVSYVSDLSEEAQNELADPRRDLSAINPFAIWAPEEPVSTQASITTTRQPPVLARSQNLSRGDVNTLTDTSRGNIPSDNGSVIKPTAAVNTALVKEEPMDFSDIQRSHAISTSCANSASHSFVPPMQTDVSAHQCSASAGQDTVAITASMATTGDVLSTNSNDPTSGQVVTTSSEGNVNTVQDSSGTSQNETNSAIPVIQFAMRQYRHNWLNRGFEMAENTQQAFSDLKLIQLEDRDLVSRLISMEHLIAGIANGTTNPQSTYGGGQILSSVAQHSNFTSTSAAHLPSRSSAPISPAGLLMPTPFDHTLLPTTKPSMDTNPRISTPGTGRPVFNTPSLVSQTNVSEASNGKKPRGRPPGSKSLAKYPGPMTQMPIAPRGNMSFLGVSAKRNSSSASSQISNGKLEESVKVDGTPKYQIVPKTKSIATNNVLPNYQPKPDSLQQSQAASLSQNSSSIAKEVVRNYLSNGTQNGLNLTQTPEQRQKNQLLNSQIEAPRDLNGVVILSDDEDEMRPVSSQNVSNGNSQALQHAQMYQNYVQQNQVQYNQHRAPRHSGQNASDLSPGSQRNQSAGNNSIRQKPLLPRSSTKSQSQPNGQVFPSAPVTQNREKVSRNQSANSYAIPPKLELKAEKTNAGKKHNEGANLTWSFASASQKLSNYKIDKYELFAYNSSNGNRTWLLVETIKALVLPMQCMLTNLTPGVISFVIRGVDTFGRKGDFSNVVSIEMNS